MMFRKVDRFMKAHGFLDGWEGPLIQVGAFAIAFFIVWLGRS
jgi:hypothetical protein